MFPEKKSRVVDPFGITRCFLSDFVSQKHLMCFTRVHCRRYGVPKFSVKDIGPRTVSLKSRNGPVANIRKKNILPNVIYKITIASYFRDNTSIYLFLRHMTEFWSAKEYARITTDGQTVPRFTMNIGDGRYRLARLAMSINLDSKGFLFDPNWSHRSLIGDRVLMTEISSDCRTEIFWWGLRPCDNFYIRYFYSII